MKPICKNCKHFSASFTVQGWCIKHRKAMSKRKTCPQFTPDKAPRYEKIAHPITLFPDY